MIRRPNWTSAKWAAVRLSIYERDLFSCRACELQIIPPLNYDGRYVLAHWYTECGEFKVRTLDMDHIVPLFLGGTNDISNFQTLCSSCNSRKGHKLEALA